MIYVYVFINRIYIFLYLVVLFLCRWKLNTIYLLLPITVY